jgi:nickel-dependent lactate racemase
LFGFISGYLGGAIVVYDGIAAVAIVATFVYAVVLGKCEAYCDVDPDKS